MVATTTAKPMKDQTFPVNIMPGLESSFKMLQEPK